MVDPEDTSTLLDQDERVEEIPVNPYDRSNAVTFDDDRHQVINFKGLTLAFE